MKIIVFVSGISLAIISTASDAYTYKCKNDQGRFIYGDKPCSTKNDEMHAETIAINGQRRLTAEQIRVIDENYNELRRLRAIEAAKHQDRLRELELEYLRSKEK